MPAPRRQVGGTPAFTPARPVVAVAVLVNGLPGAGKTTLARALARELGLPLLSKDTVKETLADALGTAAPTPEWSRALGRAAGETLWSLLAEAPAGAVLESPWLAHLRPVVAAGLERAGVREAHRVHEVWCEVPLAVARRRCEERAPSRHAIHVEQGHDAWEFWATVAEPLALGGPLHRVDTTGPVDVAALAAAIAS